MDRNVENFLNELTELTRKYKVIIGGCGCCGSPFLYPIEGHKIDDDSFNYDNLGYSGDKYTIK